MSHDQIIALSYSDADGVAVDGFLPDTRMNTPRDGAQALYAFTVPLALLVAATGLCGLLCDWAYAKETAAWVVQGKAQDAFDIAVLVPLLLCASYFYRKGSRPALFVLLGSLLYSLYTYVIYCFALHFNALFLVYCGVLGLSFYAILYVLLSLNLDDLKGWFDAGRPVTLPSVFLIVLAAVFALLWLSEDVPAIVRGLVPQSLVETGLMTNPVHVLDLAFFLPGCVACGIFLKRRHPLGYLFGPALLAFLAVMALSIGAMFAYQVYRGVSSGVAILAVFGVLFAADCLVLRGVLKNLKKGIA
jgi:hypothetical protein